MSLARPLRFVVIAAALVPAGCGDDGGDEAPTPRPPEGEATSCQRVLVPGHQAVDVRARGIACAEARRVIAEAAGRGRQPYEAMGFACEPSEAPGGDTDYACTRQDARISFRYGVR